LRAPQIDDSVARNLRDRFSVTWRCWDKIWRWCVNDCKYLDLYKNGETISRPLCEPGCIY